MGKKNAEKFPKPLAEKYFFIILQSDYNSDRWCNGSTSDFGSVSLGSNPGRSTKKALTMSRAFFITRN
jgi:hypothetical protein